MRLGVHPRIRSSTGSTARGAGGRATGFTLVELLVAISVIALLIGLMIPSLRKVRDTSYRVVCSSNVRQIGLGIALFTDDNKGVLPAQTQPGSPLRLWQLGTLMQWWA